MSDFMYSAYIDRQGGGYYAWYTDCENTKHGNDFGTYSDALRWIKKILQDCNYRVFDVCY